MNTPCPCQSSLEYNLCCGRYHKGKLSAPTAEALMRSRYSAYSLNLGRYLFKTWHKSTRPSIQSLLQNDESEWLSLKIVKTEQGMEQDDTGIVAFVATYSRQNQINQLSETSRFEKVKGQWVYVDALDVK
ncbi:MAG TPA: hypothetical protein EYG68_01615 [Leucothrix mucor]|nr:hypothetical protein [Leucothrix mucor]